MADTTLLVPGTQATSLADENGTTVYNAVKVSLGLSGDDLGGRPPDEWQRLLSIDTPEGDWAPSKTSLEPGTTVEASTVVGAPYTRMLSFADPWPYDWRLDIRYNAQQLLEYMRRNKPSNGRFNLIGHSQGGLVIILASKLTFDINEFSRLVARVVLVASPLAGTMRATEALLWGSEGLGAAHVKAARGMALTWPSLYQMLPTWKAVRTPDDDAAPDDQQFLEPGGWPGAFGDGVQPDLLKRARESFGLMHGPFGRMTGTGALAILGKRQMTPVTVVRDGDVLPADRADMRNQQGDTLVPYKRTVAWGGTRYGDHVVAFTGSINAHAMMCNDPDVVQLTQRFLDAPAPDAPTAPPATPPPTSLEAPPPDSNGGTDG